MIHLDSVIEGDCRDWLRELPKDSIDLVMTSPPYWTPKSPASSLKCVWDGSSGCRHNWSPQSTCNVCGAWKGELGLEPSRDRHVAHLLEIFRLLLRVLKPGGSFYLNVGDHRSSASRRQFEEEGGIPSRIETDMLHDGWKLIDRSIWQRPNTTSSGYRRKSRGDCELLYHFVKSAPKAVLWRNSETGVWVRKMPPQRSRNLRSDKDQGSNLLGTTMSSTMKTTVMIASEEEARNVSWGQVWQPFRYYFDFEVIRGLDESGVARMIGVRPEAPFEGRIKPPHFETFPEEFCVRPILSSCPPEGLVVDPFAGSGTTLLVAKKLGRHYLGCELNPDYVTLARRRLSAVKMPK